MNPGTLGPGTWPGPCAWDLGPGALALELPQAWGPALVHGPMGHRPWVLAWGLGPWAKRLAMAAAAAGEASQRGGRRGPRRPELTDRQVWNQPACFLARRTDCPSSF